MGRAKSQTLKQRASCATQEAVVLRAVEIYRQSLTSDLPLGFRKATIKAQQEYFEKIQKWIDVPHTTVRNRHNNIISKAEASMEHAHLTPAQEEIICDFAIETAARGFPLNNERLAKCANEVLRAENPDFEGVGKNWADRFVERHYEKLGT